VLGTVNPVREIGQLAHRAGALYLVDGAQSAPHIEVDVTQIDCDFFALSGHKMLAPMGIGALYARRELLEVMPPFLGGGEMIADVTLQGATWNKLPWKFEAGTANVCGGIALGGATDLRSGKQLEGAVDYLQRVGMARVHAHERELTTRALQGLQGINGITVHGPLDSEERAGVVSFTVAGGDAHLVAELLNDEGIAVRSGGHCAYPLAERLGVQGTVRASFYLYNSIAEVDRFLNVLEHIVRLRLL